VATRAARYRCATTTHTGPPCGPHCVLPAPPAYVVLAPHWSTPTSMTRPHIVTPGERWPVPSDIAVCGAQVAGPAIQWVGRPDEACDACQTDLAANPRAAYVAQGPATKTGE
jgi:hypothetical protein